MGGIHPDIAAMGPLAPKADIENVRLGLNELFSRLFLPHDGVEIRLLKEYHHAGSAKRPSGFYSAAESHWFGGRPSANAVPFGAAAKHLVAWNVEPGLNAYFGVNPRKVVLNGDGEAVSTSDKGGKKTDIDRVVCLHADLDGIPPEAALELAAKAGLELVLVGSGVGSHGYVLLKNSIPLEAPGNVALAERLNRRLGLLFGEKLSDKGSDHAHDVSRILRVPALINWPNEAKRKKGRVPVLCGPLLTTDRRYALEELDALLPALPDERPAFAAGFGAPEGKGNETEPEAGPVFSGGFSGEEESAHPAVDQRVAAECLEMAGADERLRRLSANLDNIVRKFYAGEPSAYWSGQSPRGERARRLAALGWKFGVGLDALIAWAHGKGGAIEADAAYWRTYQERYLAPHHPEGHGLVERPPACAGEPGDERPLYRPPSWSEVREAVRGSPLAIYVEEAARLGPGLPEDVLLLDALMVASLAVAQSGAQVFLAGDDREKGIAFNLYGLKVMRSGSGKGETTGLAMEVLKRLGVSRLMGHSQPAIVSSMKSQNAPRGYYYLPEISGWLDATNAASRQMANFFLEAFDLGEAEYSTRPGGKDCILKVENAFPSLYAEGQPSIVEQAVGATVLGAGFIARLLVAFPPPTKGRFKVMGAPSRTRIASAYEPYTQARRGLRIEFERAFSSRGAEYADAGQMTDGELSCWQRLEGQSIPKFGGLLAPDCLETGRLTREALDRGAVVADWYFAQSQRLLGIVHCERGEGRRCRAERYIAEHPGCSERDLLRFLKCSRRDYDQDVAATIEMRGGACRKEERRSGRKGLFWYPAPIAAVSAESHMADLTPVPPPRPVIVAEKEDAKSSGKSDLPEPLFAESPPAAPEALQEDDEWFGLSSAKMDEEDYAGLTDADFG
ncbi:MAG: YfjI family protein [Planctomycetota bacterium]|nr:YfjI family protein [Planctomycetota bacterium]